MTETTTNPIQQARDALAKWREKTTPGQWQVNLIWSLGMIWDDAMLTVGTAGNPELLEAIDAMLKNAQWHIDNYGSVEYPWASMIAAAIIAADERMSA